MFSADHQALFEGQTIYALTQGHVTEHVIAQLQDDVVLFEQPEEYGPSSAEPSDVFVWYDAAERALAERFGVCNDLDALALQA